MKACVRAYRRETLQTAVLFLASSTVHILLFWAMRYLPHNKPDFSWGERVEEAVHALHMTNYITVWPADSHS